jgi:RNA polymerase sigma-70 factor (ECF subfamily)
MRSSLELLLRAADAPNPERAEVLWAEYRAGGAGADAAFATLLAWYGLALYRRVWGFVRSDAAEDVFQDVLAKWHRARPKLATFDHALRWVRTVAVRQCIDAHRKLSRRKNRERRASRPEGEPPADGPELREELTVALAKLPAKHREVVALVFFEGLDQQAAALALCLHRDTVKARLDGALARLQKLVSAPAVVAAAGAAGVSGALLARPVGPSIARLGSLAEGAMARAAHSTWRLGRVAAVFAFFAGAAGIALAAWPRPEPPETQNAEVRRPAPPVEVETLQARNVRLARQQVVPLVIPQLESLLPKNNSVELVDVRGFGSKVECEFRTTRPFLGKKPAAVRYRYCVLRRFLEVDADLHGTGNWKRTDPDRPIVISIDIPGLIYKDAAIGTGQAAAIRRAFEQLPGDERAEWESVASWFPERHPAPGEVFLPVGWRAMAGNSRDLYYHANDEGLYVLRDATWQYAGYCPGWLSDADDTHLYRNDMDWIYARSIIPGDSPWARLCPTPPGSKPPAVLGRVRSGGGRLFVTLGPPTGLWSRSLDDPKAEWVRQPWLGDTPEVNVVGDRLVTIRGQTIIARTIAASDWIEIGSLPPKPADASPGGWGLTSWQGRVLSWYSAGGPIYARRLDTGDAWTVIGGIGPRPTR